MQGSRPARTGAAPFCHVVRREAGKRKFYVVHTGAPRVVVEMESARDPESGEKRGVIRRVCMPNSWTSDYHIAGKHVGEAVAFFEATTHLRLGPDS